jgi:hypothetical protein
MKRLIFIVIVVFVNYSTYSQAELLDRLEKNTLTIDSLKRVANHTQELAAERQSKLKKLEDSLKVLKTELSKMESFKANQKTDSILLLSSQLSQKEKENKKNVTEAKEQGKQEALANLTNYYLKNTFEVLIQSSTKQSIQKDQQLFGDKTELKSLLSDLDKYFKAKELLNKKYDPGQIQKAQNELNQIKRESELLSNLKNDLRLYKTYNDGLKEMLSEIVKIDADPNQTVSGLPEEVQKLKFYKISSYIFNYDFNLTDFPYLSDIVLEIIKRKTPSPDAEVSDLIQKLY